MLKRIDHVGILVHDLDEAKNLLSSLGLPLIQKSEAPAWGRIWAYFHCGNAEIELIQDLDPDVRRQALGGKRARVEHVAFEVDDFAASFPALASLGITPDEHGVVTGRFSGRDRQAVWTKPPTFDGVIWQLVSYPTSGRA